MKKVLPIFVWLLATAVPFLHAQRDSAYINRLLAECDRDIYTSPQHSLDLARRALSLSQQAVYLKGGGEAIHKIGIVHDITGRYDSALYYFNILSELGSRTGDSVMWGKGLNSRGLALWNMGKPEESLPLFFSSYDVFDRLGNPGGKAKAMNNISLVYMDMDRDREAIEAAFVAIDNFRQNHDLRSIAAPLNNIALYHMQLGNLDSAALYLQRSVELKQQYHDYYGLGISYNAFGNLYDKRKDYKMSAYYFAKAIEYKERVGDRYGYISSTYNLADAYTKQGNRERGYALLKSIVPLAEELGSNRVLHRIYHGLFLYHAHKHDYKKALDYYVAQSHAKDSVSGQERREKMDEMRTRYETEAREQENRLLKEQNRVQELEALEAARREDIKTVSLLFSVALLLLFVGFAVLFYKRYRQKQEIRLALEVQQAEEKERSRIARDLHDNVGAHLAFIIQRLDRSGSDEAQQLSQSAENAMTTLRETVWALNQNNLSAEEFSDRLKTFIRTLHAGFPQFTVELTEDIEPGKRLSPGTALNLFRLCQEAISNAFRHSGGTRLRVYIAGRGDLQLEVEIRDDGIGFNPVTDAKKDHYGLENMKHRAAEAGAGYHLYTEPGKGTRILIRKTA